MSHSDILKTGTTSIALILKKEKKVVFATDTQASMENGQWFNCGPKYEMITDTIVLSGGGSAADLRFLQKQLIFGVKQYERLFGVKATVQTAKTILATYLYERYMRGVPCFSVVHLGGFINNEPVGYTFDMAGSSTEVKDFDCIGSGSRYSTAILQNAYKEDLSEQEAVELVKKALEISKKYDLFTGLQSAICVLDQNNFKIINV